MTHLTVRGVGFGTAAPFDGDSRFIMFENRNQDWRAGCGGRLECGPVPNLFTLRVSQWTDDQIVIDGLTGAYVGTSGEVIDLDDTLEIWVWNPQTGAGPARFRLSACQLYHRC
jgi:hypothetical protein